MDDVKWRRHIPSFGTLAVFLQLFVSCNSDRETTPEMSAWSAAERSFNIELLNENSALRISNKIPLAQFISVERYEFLHILELTYVDERTRNGWFACALDEWPMALPFTMKKQGVNWNVETIGGEAEQLQFMAFLGSDGLPTVQDARPWEGGGLSGFDLNGRPTTSVFVGLHKSRVVVSNTSLPFDRKTVTDGLRKAFDARSHIARNAHAMYVPQVAIGLGRNEKVPRLKALLDWAFEAGAQSVELLVKRKDGKPGSIRLARAQLAPRGKTPNALELRLSQKQFRLRSKPEKWITGQLGSPTDGAVWLDALSSVGRNSSSVDGVLLRASPLLNYATLTKAIARVRTVLPHHPLALETEP